MIEPYNNNYFIMYPFLPPNCQKPPTIYSILETIVNPDADLNEPSAPIKIKDLAKIGRTTIFNFDYPLSNFVSKEKFETMILNHFLMRRIGFETVTAFRIQLDVKLNEIMPLYNKMFESLNGWNIFEDGEKVTRTTESSNKLINKSETTGKSTDDLRYSDTPQNQLENLRDGSYVTDANYNQRNSENKDESTSNGTSESVETIIRTPSDKIALYKEFQENIKTIYGMIFKDLECLFYQLI